MKERLQRLMDEYAGGISQFYRTNEERLDYALRHIAVLQSQFRYLRATDSHELMQAMETIDRVDVAEAVVHHLKARKETRWAGWQTRSDYPGARRRALRLLHRKPQGPGDGRSVHVYPPV